MATPPAIRQKLARLQAGGKIRVLDLFSGCGGLSLGFHAAGCEITAAIEHDPDAARSHGLNFHGGDARHIEPRDISSTPPAKLTKALGLGHQSLAFDVVIGGPPCQAFARVGRSKLREVADHPEAFRHDPRARLYIEYLDYVEECAPLAVLMENVPDILNHGGHNIAEEICDVLESRGYRCGYTLLNAARYGVPQMRERMFLIAYREELQQHVDFPDPTHWIDLPAGYEGSRAVALKLLSRDLFAESGHYISAPEADPDLEPAITAEQAVGDLPAIYARKLLDDGLLTRGARRFNIPLAFIRPPSISRYAELMRCWPGFEAKASLYDHVIRYLPRDYDLFSRLKPGDQYPEAYACALTMFEEKLSQLRKKKAAPEPGTAAWRKLRDSIVPPYDPDKFPNKWRKMEADRPARTLMAHLGKDSYSHIHYDSGQGRTISVREAARLQSFPDGFVFSGTMNPAFRQIGNAVPPLLAKCLAKKLVSKMRAGVGVMEATDEAAELVG